MAPGNREVIPGLFLSTVTPAFATRERPPGFFTHLAARVGRGAKKGLGEWWDALFLASASREDGVRRHFSGDDSGEEPGLDFEHSPMVQTIAEERMGHEGVHALFVCYFEMLRGGLRPHFSATNCPKPKWLAWPMAIGPLTALGKVSRNPKPFDAACALSPL